jgi:hypothetical protein
MCFLSAVTANSFAAFVLLCYLSVQTNNTGLIASIVPFALQHGRSDMIAHIWNTYPDITRFGLLAILTKGLPSLLELFNGPGNDVGRADMFCVIVKDRAIAKIMREWKRNIINDICWRRHEVLLAKFIKIMKIRASDLEGQRGISNTVFLVIMMLKVHTSVLQTIPLHCG